ncbi:cell division protein divIC (FtsB) [Haloferula helveola]|uniref:Cell division protein divIC (FtsB) n=1 Tax=Haloferula helveola TaxID=490095 RepID=A0ABN6H5G7_9BACT|nr:cell division protein divIC (FtsB) [Haloferula helveola]
MSDHAPLPDDPLDARQFEIVVRRLADALAYGQESSPFLGAGIEYVQSRLYQNGDPVKFMDWKVTGRTGRYHVKEYEAPRQMPVYLLVDTSASMRVGSCAPGKYAWAVRIAGGLALAAVEHMNPVGLMGVGGAGMHHTPSLSRGSIMQWLHQLRHERAGGETTLGRRVRELIPRVEQRCLFVVISDLHDPDAVPAIKRMAQDHDCLVIHLEDPAEQGTLKAGFFRGVEAETGRSFVAHGHSRFVDRGDGTMLARAGISYLHLPTDEQVLPSLRHFMKNRAGTARRR